MIGVFLYIFILLGQEKFPIEELNMITGIGYDIEKKSEGIIEYILPLSINVYKSDGSTTNLTVEEKGKNIGEVTQKRQEKLNKKIVQGQERIVLISEKYAKYGVKTITEDRFRNAEISDMAFAAVCKGEPQDYLKQKAKGYNSSAEYIYGLIENCYSYSFFSNNYKLIDMYVRIGAEGRNLVLPYIEQTEEGIELMGLAIFNGDKMIAKTNVENARILNLLKESYVKGLVSLQKSPTEYIDFYAESGKRKINCNKQGEKYIFSIDLALTGTIVNNEMYAEITKDIDKRKEFEKDMAKNIEKQCYVFLKMMQKEYKVDCISLGREGAAKFGRSKENDWNKIVSDAEIKVNVKVKVDTQGRGDY